MFSDLETLRAAAPEDSFVIGGASVYRQLLPWCDTAYVTKIDRTFPADCYQKSERSADHMRAQLSDYLEDAAKARIELDDAKREIEKLRQRMDAAQTGSGN